MINVVSSNPIAVPIFAILPLVSPQQDVVSAVEVVQDRHGPDTLGDARVVHNGQDVSLAPVGQGVRQTDRYHVINIKTGVSVDNERDLSKNARE